MARTKFIALVRELHGAFTNDGTIFRRKIYRDDNGRIKGMSKPEIYAKEHNGATATRWTERWLEEGLVKRTQHGQYRKTA